MAEPKTQSSARNEDGAPRPRFAWLAVFQVLIIALVILMARETRGLIESPMLEEQLGALSEGEVKSEKDFQA